MVFSYFRPVHYDDLEHLPSTCPREIGSARNLTNLMANFKTRIFFPEIEGLSAHIYS